MGCESIGWVLVYIAAFGVSDTLVAIVMPRLDRLLVWYSCIGIVGARMIMKSDGSGAMPRDDASQSALKLDLCATNLQTRTACDRCA